MEFINHLRNAVSHSGKLGLHFYSPPEPGEPFAPPYPPEIDDMEDEFFLPFPETDSTEK